MASFPYNIHLAFYDGPLDLLLDLIRKQEMDIHNIPIAAITSQYLEYLHKLEQLDIDVSADFIYMAATLILIKSKMLLPPDPIAGPEDQGDPRAELVSRLVEHEKFKNAAQLLFERQQLEAHVWSKPDLSLYQDQDVQGELVVSLVDLVRVFQQVLERRKEVARIDLTHDEFTVEKMMEILRSQLLASDEDLELVAFFESCPARSAMICALLAVLELVRLQAVVLLQRELFGPIFLRKHKMFDALFAGGGAGQRGNAPAEMAGGALDGAPGGSPDGAPDRSRDGAPDQAPDQPPDEPLDQALTFDESSYGTRNQSYDQVTEQAPAQEHARALDSSPGESSGELLEETLLAESDSVVDDAAASTAAAAPPAPASADTPMGKARSKSRKIPHAALDAVDEQYS
jgi:segregation and condensation protein A